MFSVCQTLGYTEIILTCWLFITIKTAGEISVSSRTTVSSSYVVNRYCNHLHSSLLTLIVLFLIIIQACHSFIG